MGTNEELVSGEFLMTGHDQKFEFCLTNEKNESAITALLFSAFRFKLNEYKKINEENNYV